MKGLLGWEIIEQNQAYNDYSYLWTKNEASNNTIVYTDMFLYTIAFPFLCEEEVPEKEIG